MKDRLVAIKKAGLDAKVKRRLVPFQTFKLSRPYRSAFVISQLMSTEKVIIFEDAKKKAFLQEAQIMKDFRGQIGFGRQMEVQKVLQ